MYKEYKQVLICVATTDNPVDVNIPDKVLFFPESYYPGNEKLCNPICLLHSLIVGLKNLAKRGKYFHDVSTILKRYGVSVSIDPSVSYDVVPVIEERYAEYVLNGLVKDENKLLQFLFSNKYHLFWR